MSAVAAERTSLITGFLGIGLSLLTIFILPQWSVPFSWIMTVTIILLVMLWIVFAAVGRATEHSHKFLPSVRAVVNDYDSDGRIVLLLEKSDLFAMATAVSIYYEDDSNLERLVAGGVVQNVQGNGLIQILVEEWELGQHTTQLKIEQASQDVIKRLRIRPFVSKKRNDEIIDARSNLIVIQTSPVEGLNSDVN